MKKRNGKGYEEGWAEGIRRRLKQIAKEGGGE